jgi:hypothetical protein
MKSDARSARGDQTGIHSLPAEALEQLENEIVSLLDKSRARCGLVLDRTGLILAAAGDFHPISPQIMGATAAGVVAALNTMVARAASPEISVRFYGSDLEKIHFLLLGDRLVLCLLLGRFAQSSAVRAAVRSFQANISPLLERYRPTQEQAAGVLKSVAFIESKLDDLFGTRD